MKSVKLEKLNHIRDNPENHQHNFDDLIRCCTVNGVIDPELMEEHRKIIPQRNPGGCDVISGPCSCGAWH